MILVDTSAWVDFFRGHDPLALRVDAALASADAVLAGPVVTELRRGLSPGDRRRVLPLLRGCPVLMDPIDLWERAGDLGQDLARRGATVKSLDLLIAMYAIVHRVPLLTRDSDFRLISRHTTLVLA